MFWSYFTFTYSQLEQFLLTLSVVRILYLVRVLYPVRSPWSAFRSPWSTVHSLCFILTVIVSVKADTLGDVT